MAAASSQTVIIPSVPGSTGSSTVIVIQSVEVHSGCPTCVTVTQYSVVLPTVATGLAMFGFDKPVVGDQL